MIEGLGDKVVDGSLLNLQQTMPGMGGARSSLSYGLQFGSKPSLLGRVEILLFLKVNRAVSAAAAGIQFFE